MPPAVRRSLVAAVGFAGALALPAVAPAGLDDAGLSPVDPSSPSAQGISRPLLVHARLRGPDLPRRDGAARRLRVRYRSRGRRGPRGAADPRLDPPRDRLDGRSRGDPDPDRLASPSTSSASSTTRRRAAATPSSIGVEGRQFYWQFVYPNGAITVNELRLPVDRVATLDVRAPDGDVIHSFWVPQLNGKRDAIPGHPNTLKLKPTELGSTRSAVPSSADSNTRRWTAWSRSCRRPSSTPGSRHARRCRARRQASSCLARRSSKAPASPATDSGGRGSSARPWPAVRLPREPATIESAVRNGVNTMPAVGEGWSALELHALAAYLAKSIATAGGSSGG